MIRGIIFPLLSCVVIIIMSKRLIAFMGIPGSGKGTFAKIVCSKLNYLQISTGDLLRAEVQNSSSIIGKTVKNLLASGSFQNS